MRFVLPLLAFLVLAGFLYVGLNLNPHEIPSPLVGKPAPAFSLKQLHDPAKLFSPQEMQGKVWLLNVWASWCESCKAEHPVLMGLAQQNIVPIYGLDYKDQIVDAHDWLNKRGNPYVLTVSDSDGRVGIDYGVYGVPETYVIDKQGIIRYKQIGAVTQANLAEKILPLVVELQAK
jgi:cytochrome c biogenesis protein CcmG/thiol:disulfide interchange protein DsbE